jgi:hypothetical protein
MRKHPTLNIQQPTSNIGGRARHFVRAVVCLAKFGAHGVARPTIGCSMLVVGWIFPKN